MNKDASPTYASLHLSRGLADALLVLATLAAVTGGGGCAGTPWFLGQPLDDRQVVPPTSRAETVATHRQRYEEARRRGEKVIELDELASLERRGALHDDDIRRFLELLKERARDWIVLRRPLPLAQDLRHIVDLDPSRARGLAPALRNAERAAGDVWLALGENARAEAEYRRADRLGAAGMLFRMRAAWGASPGDLDRPVLERALSELPERALAPFTAAYLDGEGERQPKLLQRGWTAARVHGPPELLTRLQALPDAITFAAPPPQPPPAPGETAAPPAAVPAEPAPDARLYQRPTLARTLLPLARLYPHLSLPGARSREWAERLLAEDPTAPDSLEFAALVDARAGRLGGAARKLVDLVFYSPDRGAGYARAARLWEVTGEGRRACLAWERAAQLAPVDDPRWCNLVACLRANPGAGDAELVRVQVRARAPLLACPGEKTTAPPLEAPAEDGGATDADVTDADIPDASRRPPPTASPPDASPSPAD
ncbi:MAG: hypothetical protein ABJA82_13620 [Myxococcales bacterium]